MTNEEMKAVNVSIFVNRQTLLAKLKQNKEEHTKIYVEALTGYRNELLALIDEMRNNIIANDNLNLDKIRRMQEPSNHINDYTAVISMFEMSTQNDIEIDYISFRKLILDQWNWTEPWLTSNIKYSRTATTKLSSM